MPEQKVADPQVPAGADEQVRIRQVAQCGGPGEDVLIDVIRIQVTALHRGTQAPRSLGDIPAPTVICCDLQDQALVVPGCVFRLTDTLLQPTREGGRIADHTQLDIVGLHVPDFALQRGQEQIHQQTDLGLRTPPVLTAEGKQGEHLDAVPNAFLYRAANAGHPGLVSGVTGLAAGLGPATVAVHDDRHVLRDRPCCLGDPADRYLVRHASLIGLTRTSGLFLSSPTARRSP